MNYQLDGQTLTHFKSIMVPVGTLQGGRTLTLEFRGQSFPLSEGQVFDFVAHGFTDDINDFSVLALDSAGQSSRYTVGVRFTNAAALTIIRQTTALVSPPTPTDIIPPSTTATPVPAPDSNGWNKSNVVVDLSSIDNLGGSGVKEIRASMSGAHTESLVAPGHSASISLNTEGTTTLIYYAIDIAGNTEPSKTSVILIDKTVPLATASIAPTLNSNGWSNTNVEVSFAGTDTYSGIDFCAGPIALQGEGAGQSASGTCTDKAGNVSAPATKNGINIDRTAPALTVNTPAAQNYAHTAILTLDWNATDALSGMDTKTGILDGNIQAPSGSSLDLLTLSLGTHTLIVSGEDKAANTAGKSVTFTVVATVESVCTATVRLRDQGAFSNNTFYNGLLGKCADAQAAQVRGQTNVVKNKLREMQSQLQAQSGKGVTISGANLLLGDIQYVLTPL